MKFSLKWLGDFIDVSSFFKDPKNLAEILTQSGLEVESFEDQKNGFKNIVVAELKSVEKHPRADRLTLCKVSAGEDSYSVVCGAKNHKAGDKVILAKIGACLPDSIVIKKTRIRGIESEGMLLSRSELALEDLGEGIWILPKEACSGQSLSSYLDKEDILFDISIQANRSDCLSHKGLAREISSLCSLPFLKKEFVLQSSHSVSVKKKLPVKVLDQTNCPRYTGRLIEGVQVGESPQWLKKYLQALGLKSINNIVDVTNFVLWDRGQPLHAFDADKIKALTVDTSQAGEKFLALDDREWVLTGKELVIRDQDKVLALAGIIGGKESSITEKTGCVFIESAYFAPQSLRQSSRRFGLETDSSYRFARGVDPNSVKEAMDLACHLIQKLAGGKLSEDFYDIYKQGLKASPVVLSLEDLESRLGYSISFSDFTKQMKKVAFKVETEGESCYLSPPSYRQDLKIKEDFIEEFARLQGYSKIPENLPPRLSLPKDSEAQFIQSQKLKTFLSAQKWQETIHYSFCDPEYYRELLGDKMYLKSWGPEGKERNVFSLNNPISSRYSLMKPLLVPDLIKNAVNHFRRNNKFGRFFELAPIFYQEGKEYQQEEHLALCAWGKPTDVWNPKPAPNFYLLKSVLQALLDRFSIKYSIESCSDLSFLHPKQTLFFTCQNQVFACLGSLHPRLLKRYKTAMDLSLAEVNWAFLQGQKKSPVKFKAFSNLPTVEKDLCFSIPLDYPAGKVQKQIRKSLGSLCSKVELFDIYEKKGERSVSFRIHFNPDGNLSWTDKNLQSFLDQVVKEVYEVCRISLKKEG